MTQKEYNRRLEISKMGNKASKETLSETKIIKCFYCNREKTIPKNYPNNFVCDECLSVGKENIDNRTKKQAKIKRHKTNVDKYGDDYIEVQHQRSMKTQNEKFNGKIGFANKDIKDKIESGNIKKYGSENYMQSEIFKKRHFEEVLKILKKYNLKLLSKYIKSNDIIKLKCQVCNNIFKTHHVYLVQGYGKCPICFPKTRSSGEIELFKFIQSLNLEIIENSNKIIQPYELDIYIPDKSIAIEYNGLYWHNDNNIKNKNYHLDKTELCKSKSIQLIHIFEDEWIFKKEIVKLRLKQILGISSLIRVHARKCEIKEISPTVKNEFLNKFHLQGEDKSKRKLGAFYNDELVSVMTFSKGNISKGSKNLDGIYELSRFCSKYHIPGIASKLLSHFKRNYDWKEIFSYADRRWSDGDLYYKLGFELTHITKPNYFYTKGTTRLHRFNFRKKYNEPKNIPEWILRLQDGYYQIWDCGHYKFILKK